MIPTTRSEYADPLSDLTIRQVTRADLPYLEWEGEYWQFREMFANLYRSTLSGRTLMWVVEDPDGELIGQAFVMLKSGERDAADGESRAYVFSFRAKEKWRNHGLGSHLMDFVEDDLRRRGYQFVTLNVSKENQGALRLYKRLGYSVTGSRPGIWSYRDPDGNVHHVNEPSWRMIKDLSIGESQQATRLDQN
jgi:ribosomal protein S18 acetylase RimI-like enzyme